MKRIFWLIITTIQICACSPSLQTHYNHINYDMAHGRWAEAANYVAKNKENIYLNKRNRLLYFLDYGYLLQQAHRYDESNIMLQKAIETIDDLYTKSISANIGAALTNDNALPFEGEDHERILVHLFSALNYAAQNNFEDARVEARLVTDRLDQYNRQYGNSPNIYRDDGFARWLSGWLLESEGNLQALNDAKIDYQTASEVYSEIYDPNFATFLPTMVAQDLLRSADYLHMLDTVPAVRQQFSYLNWPSAQELAQQGQLLFIHQNGQAPYKEEEVISLSMHDPHIRALIGHNLASKCYDANLSYVKFALPRFVRRPRRIVSSTILVNGKAVQTELVENIEAISIQTLADHIGRIKARTITRAVTRKLAFATEESLLNRASSHLAITAMLINSSINEAIEHADLRSWTTLPAEIRAARLYLQPGTYTVTIEYRDRQSQLVKSQTFDDVQVTKGGRVILNVRTLD